MVHWYNGTMVHWYPSGRARGVIWRDGVMAGHVEYEVLMIGEDVNGLEIDKRIGMRIGMIDGMIRMMSGVN